MVRLNANGTIDPAFATALGFNGSVRSIVPAGNQGANLYVGGDFTSTTAYRRIVSCVSMPTERLIRPLRSERDSTTRCRSSTLAEDGSGNLYVGGAFTLTTGSTVNGLVRLKADGSVDPTFVIGTGFDSTVYYRRAGGERAICTWEAPSLPTKASP